LLIPAVGRKARELALDRMDRGETGRDELIATALAGDICLARGDPAVRGE